MKSTSRPPHEFVRFVEAQDPIYERVKAELSRGRKETHWMWFVFPQIAGLGFSVMSHRYALKSLAEARRYLRHPILGRRLLECTGLVIDAQTQDIKDIFPDPDDLKFRSSMTLFALADPDTPIFEAALIKYFGGEQDVWTVKCLEGEVVR